MARNLKDSYRKNKQAYLNADDDNRFAQIKDVEDLESEVSLTGVQTLTNKTLTSPKINEDVICSATATLLNLASVKATYGTRFFYLGTPELDDVDKVVTTANMKVGTYTIAASPDVPRVITITHAAGDTVDTLGTITIAGTDSAGTVISEVLTPSNGTIVTGLKAFKTVTSATGAGWVIDGSEATADTITIGCGPALGLPEAIVVSDTNSIGYLDGVADAISAVGSGADVANSTVTITSALDGSATVQILTNAS